MVDHGDSRRNLIEAPARVAFDKAMGVMGPFEHHPALAVAVSGGADSLALVLLAHDWAEERGGHVVALTVDHGLRETSSSEASQVAQWMHPRGIEHHILTWKNSESGAGLQARARDARYDLLSRWCRDNGVLHVLLGHHCLDQAETVEMRRRRSEHGEGLSGMAAVSEPPSVRLLRPLLDVHPNILRDMLRQMNQSWIDDPSNRDERFERVRVRHALKEDVGEELRTARATALARVKQEQAVARSLADCVNLSPHGFARIDRARWNALGHAERTEILARVVRTISGANYKPRREASKRLMVLLKDSTTRSATLGGCRIMCKGTDIFVCREAAKTQKPVLLRPGVQHEWDRRFGVRISENALRGHYSFGPLAVDGWRQCKTWPVTSPLRDLPAPVRRSIPCIRRNREVLWVFGLTERRLEGHPADSINAEVRPIHAEPLGKSRFFVASPAE